MLNLGTSFLASVARDPEALAIVDGDVRLSRPGPRLHCGCEPRNARRRAHVGGATPRRRNDRPGDPFCLPFAHDREMILKRGALEG